VAREVSEDLDTIKPIGMTAIQSTGDHPLWVMKRKDFRNWKHRDRIEPRFDWVKAKDIEPYDMVSIPKIKSKNEQMIVDLSQFSAFYDENTVTFNNRIHKYGPKTHPRFLEINEEIGWLIGLYAGDGCIHSKNQVRIDLGSHEVEIIERVKQIAHSLGVEVSIKEHSKSKKCTQVYLRSQMLARLLSHLVPGFCLSKTIDKSIIDTEEKVRLVVLAGHLDSDGCIIDSGMYAASASYNLMNSLSNIANSCGFLLKTRKYNDCFHIMVPRTKHSKLILVLSTN
jgi:intein/homing endonuclease